MRRSRLSAVDYQTSVKCMMASLVSAALLGLSACGEEGESSAPPPADGPLKGQVTVDRLPMPVDPHLIKGREVWAGTCQGCHALGIAGAPKITDKKAWAPRIEKGPATLHQHAMNGFFGPDGAMMPARGGNDALSDDEVRAAVDYMISNSQ